MKKFSIQFLLVVLLSLAFITPAFCQSASASDIEQEAVLTISEPGTDNSWSWNIPEEQIKLQILPATRSGESETIYNGQVTIDLTEYLQATYDEKITSESTLRDSVVITTGLVYSFNESDSTVRVYNVYGSTIPTDAIFYAENRRVTWRNPGAYLGGVFHPTSNSWNYSVDSTPGAYTSVGGLIPYSLLDCHIRVSGMSSYDRLVSVQYTANIP